MLVPAHVIFAAERARAVIEAETYRSVNSETGGLLVGRLIEYDHKPVLVVVAATGPGPRADRRPLYYGSDRDYLQRELETLRDEFAELGVDYVGEWHKHPPDIPKLSWGDIQQARKILEDPDYRLPGDGLLLPLTFLAAENFEWHCFYLSRGLVDPIELDVIDQVQDYAAKAVLRETLQPENTPALAPVINSVFYVPRKQQFPTRLGRDRERLHELKERHQFEFKPSDASGECVDLEFHPQAFYLKDWPDLLPRAKRAYLNTVSIQFVQGYPKRPVIKIRINERLYTVKVNERSALNDNAPLDHLLEAFFAFLLKEHGQKTNDFELLPTSE